MATQPHTPNQLPCAGPEAREGWVCPKFLAVHFVPYQKKGFEGVASAASPVKSEHRPSNAAVKSQAHEAHAPGGQESASKVGGSEGEEGRAAILRKSTVGLLAVYKKCTGEFKYQTSLNPRRCLTKPSETEGDSGFDNKDADLVVYVNDELVSTASGRKYVVVDKLGQGTFGQVVKCQLADTNLEFAVKIVRNKQVRSSKAVEKK